MAKANQRQLGVSKAHEYYADADEVRLYETNDPLVRSWNGGYGAVYYRYDQPYAWFIPTRATVKAIKNGTATKHIIITRQAIERAAIVGFGR